MALFAALAWLWFVLINQLRVEWTLNPQYSYGWAVPFLCAFLLWQRISQPDDRCQTAAGGNQKLSVRFLSFVFCLLAFLYFPTRLIEEANPEWRLVSWALALEVVGLTLISLKFLILNFKFNSKTQNSKLFNLSLSDFLFPVCFFLVAVPWPTFLEQPLIQGFTRMDAGATCELLGWLGVPAMPHGNIIEVATGEVGIAEACSGIRSFQATLMISLFLGELYRLNFTRRIFLVFGGFAMSIVFNLMRMTILVWIAAHDGISAISKWHDPTGVTILIACFCGLWALGIFLKKAETLKIEKLKEIKSQKSDDGNELVAPKQRDGRKPNFSIPVFQFSVFALCVWIVLTETSVEAWYHFHEIRLPRMTQWTVAFPTNNPSFAKLPLPDRTRQILRYDEGRAAKWDDGFQWQAIFLRWNPGRTAVHLAQNHTPEVCMTAAGHTLKSISDLQWFDVDELHLPFAIYEVTDTPQPFFVFYCLWDDRAVAKGFGTMSLNYGNRLAPVLAGLRNPGQRSLEMAVNGPANADEAEIALRAELKKLVRTRE